MDLIVFSVKMGADGNRQFKESTKGMGKSCGSAFVDKRMRKLLRSKLKKLVDPIPPAALENMMETFIGKNNERGGWNGDILLFPVTFQRS